MPLALIVGAGIGGLAAGIALRRANWDIRIFERASAPRELGFGIALAPNAIAALRELGVADAVMPHAITPSTAEIRRPDGRVIRRMALRPGEMASGDRLSVILRPALHGALLEAAGPGNVEVNRDATGFEIVNGRARVLFARGDAADGDIIVGADGFNSAIRASLHPGEPPARPSGYLALRGASDAIERMRGVQAFWYFGPGIESGVVQAGARSIYWFLSLVRGDIRAAGEPEEVLRLCTEAFDPQFKAITWTTPGDRMRLDELFVRDPLPSWGLGPVTLLGDAAHPMLPHTGQGGAQALEDAASLGRALRGAGLAEAGLRRYEAERVPRTRRVVQSGPRIAQMTTTRSTVVAAVRNGVFRIAPRSALVKAFTGGTQPRR